MGSKPTACASFTADVLHRKGVTAPKPEGLGFKGMPPHPTLFCSTWTLPGRLVTKEGFSRCSLPVARRICSHVGRSQPTPQGRTRFVFSTTTCFVCFYYTRPGVLTQASYRIRTPYMKGMSDANPTTKAAKAREGLLSQG